MIYIDPMTRDKLETSPATELVLLGKVIGLQHARNKLYEHAKDLQVTIDAYEEIINDLKNKEEEN
tara:strand:+ start:5033 stop:5227 length:195 start_codon:yes stop_codon:yes gene_type:complete